MKRLYWILCGFLFCNSISAQIDDCFADRVANGDSLFSIRNYEAALDYFNAAKSCVNQPEDLSELNKKINKTKNEIKKARIQAFSLSKDYVYIKSRGEKDNIIITLGNIRNWDFDKNNCPDWLVITKTKDGFIYECQPNNQPIERTCTINLKAGSIAKNFRVRQEKASEYLMLSQTALHMSPQGGEQSVTVSTNAIAGYNIISQCPWASVTSLRNNVIVTVKPNPKHDPRYGNIYVRTEACSQLIRVTQEAKPSKFLLDVVALRILSDFELSMSFRLENGNHIQFDGGLWDILRYNNLSGGISASYIWSYEFAEIWALHYGVGLGIGGVRRPYADPKSRFVIAAVPSVSIECAPIGWEIAGKQVGLTLDYRPYVGTDCAGFYHNLTNFNLGVRLHLH